MQRKFKQSQNNWDNEIKLLAMLKEEKIVKVLRKKFKLQRTSYNLFSQFSFRGKESNKIIKNDGKKTHISLHMTRV